MWAIDGWQHAKPWAASVLTNETSSGTKSRRLPRNCSVDRKNGTLGNQQSLALEQSQCGIRRFAMDPHFRRQKMNPGHQPAPPTPQQLPTQMFRQLLGSGLGAPISHNKNLPPNSHSFR